MLADERWVTINKASNPRSLCRRGSAVASAVNGRKPKPSVAYEIQADHEQHRQREAVRGGRPGQSSVPQRSCIARRSVSHCQVSRVARMNRCVESWTGGQPLAIGSAVRRSLPARGNASEHALMIERRDPGPASGFRRSVRCFSRGPRALSRCCSYCWPDPGPLRSC
jgi:hypothetical protein